MTRDEIKLLESVAVDQKHLATNFVDVVPDCCGPGADVKTELMNRYQLYYWLINTSLSRRVRDSINSVDRGMCNLHYDATAAGYVIEVPQTYWSLPATDTSAECCWQPFDFAKCGGNVPVKRLCLKDCDNIDNELLGRVISLNGNYGELGRRGESVWNTKKRIARMSMAFLTANNAILGTDNNTTDILKPFHGLLQVVMNPAVAVIEGANILSAFDSMWCRMSILGEEDFVFATNPLIYNSILSVIRVSERMPLGWSLSGEELRFHGIRFLRDRRVPVNLATSVGEVWVLSGSSVGLWMATDLMPADAFIKESGHQEQSLADGCGSSCTYYYNYGAAFNNNANKIMRIVNIPVSGYCTAATSDLGNLVQPQTLIPTTP